MSPWIDGVSDTDRIESMLRELYVLRPAAAPGILGVGRRGGAKVEGVDPHLSCVGGLNSGVAASAITGGKDGEGSSLRHSYVLAAREVARFNFRKGVDRALVVVANRRAGASGTGDAKRAAVRRRQKAQVRDVAPHSIRVVRLYGEEAVFVWHPSAGYPSELANVVFPLVEKAEAF